MNIIFHIDVNNAFLSWSAISLLQDGYPEDIREIPSVIAGDESKRHGIVLAKSNISKKYGIKTAETLHSARQKCKNLQIFPPNYAFYKKMSDRLYEYYLTYTPDVERYSIDECFLDLTNTNYLYDDVLILAYKMKEEIKEKFGFTVNIGIGNNKLCAKMAGDFSKPDKVHTLFSNEIKEKMWPLPIEDLLYVGKSSSRELRKLNIKTIGDLANFSLPLLKKHFKNNATFMIQYANGIDSARVISKSAKNKSISFSETLEFDTNDKDFLKKKILLMCEKIGFKLREEKLYARTIAIFIKTDVFISYSHQKKLLNETNNTMELYNNALTMLDEIIANRLVRLIGVRVSDLVNFKSDQISLFSKVDNQKEDKIQEVMDDINLKYKDLKIMPAIFYKDKKK